MKKEYISNASYGGERPLFAIRNLRLRNVTILPGESALKECFGIEAVQCEFTGKYPFWHNEDLLVRNSNFREGAPAANWYCTNMPMDATLVEAPK